jgi:hypothetical protein
VGGEFHFANAADFVPQIRQTLSHGLGKLCPTDLANSVPQALQILSHGFGKLLFLGYGDFDLPSNFELLGKGSVKRCCA